MENILLLTAVVMVFSLAVLLVVCMIYCVIIIMTRPKIVDERKNEKSDKIILFS